MREVRWYFLSLVVMGTAGAVYVWLSEPPIPPPPVIDTSRAAAPIAEAIEEDYEEAKSDPKSGYARGRLGMICFAHEYRREALECFRQAERLEPKQFRWRYYRAILEEDYNLATAADAYKAARTYRSDYAPLYLRMADVLVRLDRPDEARKNYMTAIELAPDSPYPLLGLARLELALNARGPAHELIDQAIKVAPWLRDAAMEKVRVLRLEGNVSEAARVEEAAAQLPQATSGMPDPFLTDVDQMELSTNRLGKLVDSLLTEGKIEEAAELLKRMIIDRPEVARVRLILGNIRMRQQHLEGAIQIFRETVDRFPNDPTAHFSLGTALESKGEFEDAIVEFAAASNRKPDYAEALYREGRVWNKLGRPENAVTPLKLSLAADPSLLRAHIDLALTLEKLGRIPEATAAARNALQLAPKDAEVHELLKNLRGSPTGASEK